MPHYKIMSHTFKSFEENTMNINAHGKKPELKHETGSFSYAAAERLTVPKLLVCQQGDKMEFTVRTPSDSIPDHCHAFDVTGRVM
jgi:hypothetical protein